MWRSAIATHENTSLHPLKLEVNGRTQVAIQRHYSRYRLEG